MIYLLDTDTLIFLIRGMKLAPARTEREREMRRKAERILKRSRECSNGGDVLALSAITVAELEFGAQCGGRYEAEMAAVQKVLAPFTILHFDAASAQHYGSIRHELENDGRSIGAMDLLIATHARAAEAVLVTNNRAHFARVKGLKVETWG